VALRTGPPAQVVPDASNLTKEYPLREEGWRLLALAQWGAGRQGDALAALRQARQVLGEELGIDPGPALTDLEEAILRQHLDVLHSALESPVGSGLPVVPGQGGGQAGPGGDAGTGANAESSVGGESPADFFSRAGLVQIERQDRRSRPAGSSDFVRQRIHALGAARHQHQFMAMAGECSRKRSADSGRGAGDDRDRRHAGPPAAATR